MKRCSGWRVVWFWMGAAAAFGQGRSAGLHGAYATLATGAEAPFHNPANLAFSTGGRTSLALLGVSVWADDNAFGLESYHRYNGAYLDDVAKRELLAAVAGRGVIGRAGVTARPISIAVGPAALSLQSRGLGRFHLAEELFDLLLRGNELDRAYDFIPAAGRAMLLSDLTLSYGYSPPITLRGTQSLSFGLNAHYFLGSWYGEVESMRARARTGATSAAADGQARLRTARGGQGWGLDLGMTAVITPRLRFALYAENLLTELRWNRTCERLLAGFSLYDTNIDRILEEGLDLEDVAVHSDTTLAIPAFSTRLPRRWHLTASYLRKRWLVSAEWRGGQEEAAVLGGSELALGGEYAPWRFLRLRTGAGHAAASGWSSAFGLGLLVGSLRWDLAWQGVGSLNPAAVRGGGFATSLTIGL
ncbi:MAG TPA: hypothetical protein PLG50_12955 [bacterium]|nr:hypothetical protein [bacterium]HQG46561.1 hypothetical protein [bacterium]HQI47388.1 hypothetical protein [bacterium]HQJ63010.1 hypothetical protein [bacterium]